MVVPGAAGALGLAASILLLSGCAPPQLVQPTATPIPGDAVVAVSEGGQLPTRPAARSLVPTATTDLALLIATVQPFATRTPGPTETPLPTVVPAYTSTPRPTPTRMTGSFPQPPLNLTVTRPPTRTPAPRGTYLATAVATSPGSTDTPVDPNEPNDTPDHATPIDVNPKEAFINGPNDVDVYRIDVTTPGVSLVVTLSGEAPNRYKVDVVAPRSGKVGRQRLDGTVAVRAIVDVGSETGTYLVYVQGAGPELPKGPYFISADLGVPVPTATRTPSHQ